MVDTAEMPLLKCAFSLDQRMMPHGLTRHSFEGHFYNNNIKTNMEVWRCTECGARRVWGARPTGDKVEPVKNWQWLPDLVGCDINTVRSKQ